MNDPVLNEAERSVIGAVLLAPDALNKIDTQPDDFFDLSLGKLMEAARALWAEQEPVDGVTMADWLARKYQQFTPSKLVDLMVLATECLEATPTSDNVAHYAQIVQAGSRRRRMLMALSDAQDAIKRGDDLSRVAAKVERVVTKATPQPANDHGELLEDIRTFVGEDEPDDEPDSPEDWIVPQLVPRGCITFLGGDPKLGKTWVGLDIGIAVALGEPVCGRWPSYPGKVFAFLEEDPRKRIQSRLWWLARGRGIDPRQIPNLYLTAMSGFRIDDEKSVERLAGAIEKHRPDLIVTDALARIHSADENDRTAMRAVTLPLQELTQRYGVAMLLIHHYKKAAQGDEHKRPGDRLRGTGDLHALARQVIGLSRPEKGGPLVLEAEGNYATVEPTNLEITTGTNERGKTIVTLQAQGTPEDKRAAEEDEKVLQMLRREPMTGRDIEASVAMRSERCRAAIKRLAQAGRIALVDVERVSDKGRRTTRKAWSESVKTPRPGPGRASIGRSDENGAEKGPVLVRPDASPQLFLSASPVAELEIENGTSIPTGRGEYGAESNGYGASQNSGRTWTHQEDGCVPPFREDAPSGSDLDRDAVSERFDGDWDDLLRRDE